MKIVEKMRKKAQNLTGESPVAIAFLGDSVTQGCFDLYLTSPTVLQTYFNAENGYHAKLRKMLSMLFPNVPVNIINGGISGGGAPEGLCRIDRDIIRFSPDICVVCFGLNDCCRDDLDAYRNAMCGIFDRLIKENIEVIFMTPNMMATHASCHLKCDAELEVADMVTKKQNDGVLEQYLEVAKAEAKKRNIPVCDCYAAWKKLYEGGVNITDNLLSNYLNHPTSDMNNLFAWSLIETMFEIK